MDLYGIGAIVTIIQKSSIHSINKQKHSIVTQIEIHFLPINKKTSKISIYGISQEGKEMYRSNKLLNINNHLI